MGSIRAHRASERSEGYGWRRARLERRPSGEPPRTDLREVINALFYVNRTGIFRRYIPHDLPPKGTVYYHYGLWRGEGILAQLNVHLTELARTKEGREPQPSAALVDTQRVKTLTNTPLETQGTDAVKKIVRKRRAIVTDACGFLLALVVLAASVSENSAGMRAIGQAKTIHPTITKAWVDQGFKNQFVEHAATLGIDAEVVTRDPGQRGFHVLKR